MGGGKSEEEQERVEAGSELSRELECTNLPLISNEANINNFNYYKFNIQLFFGPLQKYHKIMSSEAVTTQA
jgi:hypothetical protein